jgi:hypothetical protein
LKQRSRPTSPLTDRRPIGFLSALPGMRYIQLHSYFNGFGCSTRAEGRESSFFCLVRFQGGQLVAHERSENSSGMSFSRRMMRGTSERTRRDLTGPPGSGNVCNGGCSSPQDRKALPAPRSPEIGTGTAPPVFQAEGLYSAADGGKTAACGIYSTRSVE